MTTMAEIPLIEILLTIAVPITLVAVFSVIKKQEERRREDKQRQRDKTLDLLFEQSEKSSQQFYESLLQTKTRRWNRILAKPFLHTRRPPSIKNDLRTKMATRRLIRHTLETKPSISSLIVEKALKKIEIKMDAEIEELKQRKRR